MAEYTFTWYEQIPHAMKSFDALRKNNELIDVTLSCERKNIPAHKFMLSACSPYFKNLFEENPCQHPIVIFRNVYFDDLSAIMEYVYTGRVTVQKEQLASFLDTGKLLDIEGLINSEHASNGTKMTARDYNVDMHPKDDPPTCSAEYSHEGPELYAKNDCINRLYWTDGASRKFNSRHQTLNHEDEQYVCSRCHLSFSNLSMYEKHFQMHVGKTTCIYCGKVMTDATTLSRHSANHEGSIRCTLCKHTFSCFGLLNNHVCDKENEIVDNQ